MAFSFHQGPTERPQGHAYEYVCLFSKSYPCCFMDMEPEARKTEAMYF